MKAIMITMQEKEKNKKKIDKILDKINTSGYDSLTDEDKRTLSNDH